MRRLPLYAALITAAASSTSSCAFFFPFAPENLCESQVRAMCHFAFNCCNANERESITISQGGSSNITDPFTDYRTEADCVEDMLERSGACAPGQAVKESIDEKRFEYDAELAEKCNRPLIDALNSCDAEKVFDPDELDLDDECDEIVAPAAYGKGLVADGDPCFAAYECEDEGARCEVEVEEDPERRLVTSVGECRAPAKEGQDCSADFFCEPGTLCDGNECVALLDNGEACFVNAQCKSDYCDFAEGVCATEPAPPKVKTKVEVCNGNQADDTDF